MNALLRIPTGLCLASRILASRDDGCFALEAPDSEAAFAGVLGELRFWARERNVDLDAA